MSNASILLAQNNGDVYPSANQGDMMFMLTSNSQKIMLGASNQNAWMTMSNGYVGVGSSNPQFHCDVSGNIIASSDISLNGTLTYTSNITNNMYTNPAFLYPVNFVSSNYTLSTQLNYIVTSNIVIGSREYQTVLQRSFTINDTMTSNFPIYITVTRGTSQALTADYHQPLTLYISGQNVRSCGWGTASPNFQNLTFSFWYKTNVTGSHWMVFGNSNAQIMCNYAYYANIAISTTNTWNYYSVNVPAPPNISATWNELSITFLPTMIASQTNTITNGFLPLASWCNVGANVKTQTPASYTGLATSYFTSATSYFSIGAPILVPGSNNQAQYPPFYLQNMYNEFLIMNPQL